MHGVLLRIYGTYIFYDQPVASKRYICARLHPSQSQANLPQADVRAFDADLTELTSGIKHVKRGALAHQPTRVLYMSMCL